MFICPTCKKASTTRTYCSNQRCVHHNKEYTLKPTLFIQYSIVEQLIIAREQVCFEEYGPSPSIQISTIADGQIYKRILLEIDEKFLTLTLNVDGVSVSNSSDMSIWIFTMVINEISRNKRFKLENIIIPLTYPGPKKPTKTEMITMEGELVKELQRLELPTPFVVKQETNEIINIRTFLIAACCGSSGSNTNVARIIAAFGCGRCTVKGKRLVNY
ncbi:unnamed protein product [Didymodactylos carnosus]|uniref:Uncharacterized protein n=1 Tax=Didymodactylos carnosus TaxID=1234261 RepID=A0A8S2FNY3_9BILA|nr:unnamed protein product [Didymodactylos carnosus]CAF4308890.1 unnamed protein product [Didymodactylos carnosus]